jgi:tetratricopeptide (TPR) repeat protein
MRFELIWVFKLTPQELGGIAEEGYLHFKNGRYPTARKVFQGLSIIEPENYYHHSMLGAISQREQKWAEAILEYSISLDMYPEDIATYTNRGECYLRLGFTEEARSDLENAVSRDSNKKNSWANRARLLQKQLEVLEKRLK